MPIRRRSSPTGIYLIANAVTATDKGESSFQCEPSARERLGHVTQNPLFDVVIVGAGLAGAATAAVLGRQGWRVALVDPRPVSPPATRSLLIRCDTLVSMGLLRHSSYQVVNPREE
jgi:NADPH-dependent 2,4-dienoyl-CoA reductase/sulfur reductase-like enzyme